MAATATTSPAPADMHKEAWMRAVGDAPLDFGVKLVLWGLALFADNKKLTCYPKQTALAARCSVHTDTIGRHLETAELAGWIHRRKRGHLPTLYTLTTPEGPHLRLVEPLSDDPDPNPVHVPVESENTRATISDNPRTSECRPGKSRDDDPVSSEVTIPDSAGSSYIRRNVSENGSENDSACMQAAAQDGGEAEEELELHPSPDQDPYQAEGAYRMVRYWEEAMQGYCGTKRRPPRWLLALMLASPHDLVLSTCQRVVRERQDITTPERWVAKILKEDADLYRPLQADTSPTTAPTQPREEAVPVQPVQPSEMAPSSSALQELEVSQETREELQELVPELGEATVARLAAQALGLGLPEDIVGSMLRHGLDPVEAVEIWRRRVALEESERVKYSTPTPAPEQLPRPVLEEVEEVQASEPVVEVLHAEEASSRWQEEEDEELVAERIRAQFERLERQSTEEMERGGWP